MSFQISLIELPWVKLSTFNSMSFCEERSLISESSIQRYVEKDKLNE